MYKVIASVLVILAILLAWYVSSDDSATPHSSNNDGINLNR